MYTVMGSPLCIPLLVLPAVYTTVGASRCIREFSLLYEGGFMLRKVTFLLKTGEKR